MGHWYDPETRERSPHHVAGWLPSVTTILSATMPYTKRMALDAAQAKDPYGFARRQEQGRDRGTLIHEWITAFLLGNQLPDVPLAYSSYLVRLSALLTDLKQQGVLMAGTSLINHLDGYAGELDILAKIDDRITLIEVKTRRTPLMPQSNTEAFIQAIAYADALSVDAGIDVDDLMVLNCWPTFFHPSVSSFSEATFIYLPQWEMRLDAYLSSQAGTEATVSEAPEPQIQVELPALPEIAQP